MCWWKKSLLCFVLAAGFLWGGCKKKSPSLLRLHLSRDIEFSHTSKALLKKLKLAQAPLLKQLRKHLEQEKSFLWFSEKNKPPATGYKLRVALGMMPLPADRKRRRIRLRWYISYRLVPVTSGREVLNVQESRTMSYAVKDKFPKRETVAKLFRDLWKRGAQSLSAYGKLYLVSSHQLMLQLKQKDAFLQRHATQILARRQYKAVIPLLIKQLKTKNRTLLLTTVGALVRLRARKAAVPLIQLARQREGAFLAQILSALSEIGGEAAKGFLFTIASSHNIPAIQQTAKEALLELKQREAKASQHTPPRKKRVKEE